MEQFAKKKRVAAKKKAANKNRGGNSNADTMTRYTGPVAVRGANRQAQITTKEMHQAFQFNSTGAGVFSTVFGSRPDTCSSWAGFAAVFDQYRTLAFELTFMPDNRYSKTTTTCLPMLIVSDRDDATALTSLAAACSYDSVKMVSLEDPWSYTMKMDGIEEAAFLDTASPANTFYIKTYVSGLSLTTGYGLVLLTYRVQFRASGL